MATRKVKVTLIRTFSKTATVDFEVDENITGDELVDFLTDSDELTEIAENRMGTRTLEIGDDIWDWQDPTNNDGGTL